jgi:DNA-directed RNA polymerase specialized sigma24 family protein
MSGSTELSSSLEEIAQRCREETERFFRRLAPDTRFCYELFRRALAQRDEEAFARLLANYAPLVEGWVRHQPGFPASREDASYFVTAAFEKLWQAVPPARFNDFADVKKLLHYLKLCAASSVIDHLRSQNDATSLDDAERVNAVEPAAVAPPLSRAERAELWSEVLVRAQNEKELIVLYACLALQMKPEEVILEYPGVFENVREVYRVKQNLIERLRRDQNLRKHLSSYA